MPRIHAATACAIFARADSFAAALTRDLVRCAALKRESMAIIAELTAARFQNHDAEISL
jgi:hypothetical protein